MNRLLVLLTFGIALAFATTALGASTTGFTTQVSPPSETNATEPSVAVDHSDGTIYVAWQASGTDVARSDDGGRTFVQTPIADLFGRDVGDVDVRVGGPTPCLVPTSTCLPRSKQSQNLPTVWTVSNYLKNH